MYKIRLIKDKVIDCNLEVKSEDEISKIIKDCHHLENKRNNTNYSIVCGCDNCSTLKVVMRDRSNPDKLLLVPTSCIRHKEDCIFYKDGIYENTSKIFDKEIVVVDKNGYEDTEIIDEVTSFSCKKRKIINNTEVFELSPSDEDNEKDISDIKNDAEAYRKRQESQTLGAVFTKIINDKYEFNTKNGKVYGFYQFMQGLDYNFKRNALNGTTIYEMIRNNKIFFGKIKNIDYDNVKSVFVFTITCMNFVDISLKYGYDQYIKVTPEEYDYACEKYKIHGIDIFNKIKMGENFYFIGLIDGNKKITRTKINCKNVYILSATQNGLVTDSLFENRVLNNLYHEGYTLFYKPTKICYKNLDFDEYKYLADAIIYGRLKNRKQPNLNEYILLECFGIKGNPDYEAAEKKKIELGNNMNIKHFPDIQFFSIDIDTETKDLNDLIKILKSRS